MDDLLAGRYRLEEELGVGGVARVYRARDSALDVVRAVKVVDIAALGGAGPATRERLQREARAMAALAHPHVLRVFDVGTDDGRDYVVMELMEAGTALDLLEREGPLHPDRAVALMVQVLDALGAAHEAGIVHRDVKPGNILIAGDGTARLADFGIALHSDISDGATASGTALGSYPYMAPEQRVDAHGVERSADVYAVGCTLYHLLTTATPVDLYLAPGRSPRWQGIEPRLVEILQRATSALPADRYPDAASMAGALQRALQPTVVEAREPAPASPPRRRRRLLARSEIWIALAAIIVMLAGGWAFNRQVQELTQPQRLEPLVVLDAIQPEGTWGGNWNDQDGATLVLEGPHASLTGVLVLSADGVELLRNPVSGSWDAQEGRLHLRDSDRSEPGTYSASFRHEDFFAGQYLGPDGEVVEFRFMRAGEPR